MKVMYISGYEFAPCARSATRPTEVIRYLPCEVVECCSEEMVHRHINDTDVALVTRPAAFPRGTWKPIIKESDALVGWFITDVWHSQGMISYVSNLMGVDIYLVAYRTCTERHMPDIARTAYWCPASTDARDCCIPRDIDVLYWGNYEGHRDYYPFRRFELRRLHKWIVGPDRSIGDALGMYEIEVGGHRCKYAYLKNLGMNYGWDELLLGDVRANAEAYRRALASGYYESKLYRLLSRARIVCTGPGMDAPIGKFFENAACGAVQVTCDFTDREDLGFEHGKNIWITDEEHFEGDLSYLLENPELVEEISGNAEELIRTRHTRIIRAQELYKFLCEKTGKT